MAKTKKKRNKRYTGSDAATTGPVVKHYEAVERSRSRQWLYEHKGRIRIFGILAAIAGFITLIISGIASLIH